MANDPTTPLAAAVRPMLAQGEELRLAARISADPGTVEDVDVRAELLAVLNPLNWLGIGMHPAGFLRRASFGRAVVGSEHSMARCLHAAVDSVQDAALVITDARVVALEVDVKFGTSTVAYAPRRVLIECPRAVVTGAELAAKGLLRRGRFIVHFGDGSRCALLAQVPSVGRRLAGALK